MKKRKARYLTNEGRLVVLIIVIGSYFPIRAMVSWIWGV